MATNNFKPFATAANANVTAQADWESLPDLLSGFTAGKASSAQVNKAIRQASFIAAALAQYTANKSGLDVLDDGDLNGFIAKMSAAFGKDFQALDATLTALAGLTTGANKLPYFTGTNTASQTNLTSVGRDIIGKGTIADILTYLGLGEAAKRNVGTGANQIPDMSLFASINTVTAAAQKFPSGLILQCGQLNGSPNVSSTYGMRFPMTFSRVLAVTVTLNVTGASGQPTVSATNVQNTGFNITVSPGSVYGASSDAYYIAMGY
ncbi:TPA: phage tail protein [Escherichia coli]|nr:phage tail protein [Escherichia coli]